MNGTIATGQLFPYVLDNRLGLLGQHLLKSQQCRRSQSHPVKLLDHLGNFAIRDPDPIAKPSRGRTKFRADAPTKDFTFPRLLNKSAIGIATVRLVLIILFIGGKFVLTFKLEFEFCLFELLFPVQILWCAPIFCTKCYESTGWLKPTAGRRQFSASGAYAKEVENCRANSLGV